jgi:3-oxoacyl-[acyl-carrier-protein] synthase II
VSRRVVVTGIGVVSPIGNDLTTASAALREGRHGIRPMPDWSRIAHLTSLVGAPVEGVSAKDYPRKKVRTMGRVALLATRATGDAIAMAALSDAEIRSGRTGLCYGSTQGSTEELERFCTTIIEQRSLEGIPGSSYLKFMGHTCAANLAIFYGITGRVLPVISACASASQSIGVGYETIQAGKQDVMLCGGAEELHFVHAAAFDLVYAASSKFNAQPELTPRPFDVARDGLVVGEGAATFVLEELEHARRRDAPILAEVLGFGMCCDGTHVTSPSEIGMATAMREALSDAAIAPDAVEYINAHATGTEVGDIAESRATHAVFGDRTPVSSTKSYTGHTLGACGAIEAAYCFAMMRDGFLAPNRNLSEVDPRCAPLDYIVGAPRSATPRIVVSNNFAFGGINTSLVLGRL